MDCGVNGFDVILPHQAGAAITVLLLSSFFIHRRFMVDFLLLHQLLQQRIGYKVQ